MTLKLQLPKRVTLKLLLQQHWTLMLQLPKRVTLKLLLQKRSSLMLQLPNWRPIRHTLKGCRSA